MKRMIKNIVIGSLILLAIINGLILFGGCLIYAFCGAFNL